MTSTTMISLLTSSRRSSRRLQQKLLVYLLLVLSFVGLTRFLAVTKLQHRPPPSSSNRNSTGQVSQRVPQVHLLLPVNKDAALRGSRFCKTAASAIMTGYKPVVYNWGAKSDDVSRTHRQKVTVLKDILSSPNITWADDDLVFVIDALDVWMQLPPADLARRFAVYDQDQVYVGAEKHCVPNPWDSPDCQNVPQSPLPRNLWTKEAMTPRHEAHSSHARHANSGTILGRVDKMRTVSRELTEILEAENYTYTGDQGEGSPSLIAYLLCHFEEILTVPHGRGLINACPLLNAGLSPDLGAFNILMGRGRLAVDHYHRLFWPSAADDSHMKWMNTPLHPDSHLFNHVQTTHAVSGAPVKPVDGVIPWDDYPTMGQHQLTGQVPVALHFNGKKGKDLLQEWWGLPWYSAERFRHLVIPKLADATIDSMKRDGTIGRTMSLRELCWDKTRGLYDGPPGRPAKA